METPELDSITIDDRALAMLLDVRARESDAEDLALVLAITGVDAGAFTYDIAFTRLDNAGHDDYVVTGSELPIVVSVGDLDNLRGARIEMSKDLLNPGLSLNNPNSPSPTISASDISELSGSVAERVVQVVNTAINPAIASHGGFVDVVAVEEATAYVRLGGGCQGCGMASVTLSQGIETTILESVPEVTRVVDVTDHDEGDNPYYEQAKK